MKRQTIDTKADGVAALVSIVDEIERQLEWRGPTGKSQGHVVLERPQGELLLQKLYDLRRQKEWNEP